MCKYIGIDISKQTFDTFSSNEKGKSFSLSFKNEKSGFSKLIKKFGKTGHYVMEATGPYYVQLATFLFEKGIKVTVVNPLVIKRFSQMQLNRAKTDKKDAQVIHQYAVINELKLWKPDPDEIREMQQIITSIELLYKYQSAVLNQLESFTSSGFVGNTTKRILEDSLKQIKQNIYKLENKLNEIVTQNYNETKELLESIPGIGPKASAKLIAVTNNFEKFEHYKQLIAYVGLSPRIYTSGTSVKGKGHICKMGKSAIRKQMYISSWSAKFYNKSCVNLYARLKEKGKPERVIKVAIANKLLKQAFAVVKNKTSYNENYVSKFIAA